MSHEFPSIVSLQTVALTREKQADIQEEVAIYHKATNQVIKEILRKKMVSFNNTVDELLESITRKYVYLRNSVGPLSELDDDQLRDIFSRRFSLQVIKERIMVERNQVESDEAYLERCRKDFAIIYEKQFVRDVVKTSRVEIGKHRSLARTLRSIRDKTPYFKPGRIIFSKPIVQFSKDGKALLLLTANGNEIPLVFDKYTRNASIDILDAIVKHKIKYDRARLTWNREGYMNIDVRLQ
jgi:hypothetical protein